MKGIIVEKEKEYAIVLDNNGQFWEIKTPQDLNIGYEVDIPSKKKISFKTIVAITAVNNNNWIVSRSLQMFFPFSVNGEIKHSNK